MGVLLRAASRQAQDQVLGQLNLIVLCYHDMLLSIEQLLSGTFSYQARESHDQLMDSNIGRILECTAGVWSDHVT